LSKTKVWIQAFRPHTLPLALAGVLLANCIAFDRKHWSAGIAVFTALTAILLQVLSNLANDYGDFKKGADTELRVGPTRMAQHGLITASQMKKAIIIFIFLSFASGIALLALSMQNIGIYGAMILFLMGIVAIAAAIAYTATKKPYGYRALGDLSVFLFFGLLSVGGSYYLQAGSIPGDVILPAAAIGLLSAGVLNVNNIRDIEADLKANKITVANLLGEKGAKLYHWSLLLSAAMLFFLFTWYSIHSKLLLFFLLPSLLFVVNGIGVSRSRSAAEVSPYLKQLALSVLAFVVVYGTGIVLF
jgi:1,4-dihydroxy-2-naphthoate octaprenyltransferase